MNLENKKLFERCTDPLSVSDNITKNILAAKIKLLYAYLPIGLIGSFLCASIVYLSLHASSISYLKEWYITIMMIALFRFILFSHYQITSKNSSFCSKLHVYFFIASAITNALTWGILASFMMPVNDVMSQMIIIVIIAGVSAGAAQSLQSNLMLSIAYTLLLILPLSTWLFIQDHITYFYLGIAMTTYLIFTLSSTWRGSTLLTESLRLQFENIILTEHLEKEATHDPLTDLFNRRYLNVTLPRELQRIIRERSSLCVVMIDIDHFKTINDTYGHEAGDIVLKVISNILTKHFRKSDIICRFGGDEFILISVDTNINKILPKLKSVQEDIRNAKIVVQNDILPPTTLSIGASEAPKQADNTKDILALTDKALYVAKTGGRDRIVCAP